MSKYKEPDLKNVYIYNHNFTRVFIVLNQLAVHTSEFAETLLYFRLFTLSMYLGGVQML